MPSPAAKRARTISGAQTMSMLWEVLRRSTLEDLVNTNDPAWRDPVELAAEHRAVLASTANPPAAREVAAAGLGLAATAHIRAGGDDSKTQWSDSVSVCCRVLETDTTLDDNAAVRYATLQTIGSLGYPAPISDRLIPQLESAALMASRILTSDFDGDVRAAAVKALAGLLSGAHDGPPAVTGLLISAVETLASRIQSEPLVMVRQVILKSVGRIGAQLRRALSNGGVNDSARAVAALDHTMCAVVAQLAREESADWRVAVPEALSILQLPAAVDGPKETLFAPRLCELLGHTHDGVSRAAEAALTAMIRALGTDGRGCGDEILSSVTDFLVKTKNNEAKIMAALSVVQAAFAETKWSFCGAPQSSYTMTTRPQLPTLVGPVTELALACVAWLSHGDGETSQPDQEAEVFVQREASLRRAAGHAVASIGKHLLRDSSEPLRASFCDAVGSVLMCNGPLHRASGLEAVGRLGPCAAPLFMDRVLSALADQVEQVRWTATVAIGQLLQPGTDDEESQIHPKTTECHDSAPSIRQAVDALQQLLENEDESIPVRVAAQEAMQLVLMNRVNEGDDVDNDEGEEEDADDGEEDESDEDDDEDDESDEDDDDESDEDERAGTARRVKAIQQRIRPHPPAVLSEVLNASGTIPDIKAPSRDPIIVEKLRSQVATIVANGHPSSTLTPIDTLTVSKAEFETKFRSTPQVLQGVALDWAAQEHWSCATALLSRWGERTKFRVGDDEANEPVLMRLGDYIRYASDSALQEANPLYLFDMQHLDRDEATQLEARTSSSDPVELNQEDQPRVRISDYSPRPHYFANDDLFSMLPSDQQPPHRWVLVGCEGSGSAIHKDPLHSSAWNTSLLGRKRWVLFPPETPRYHVAPRRVPELWPTRLRGPSAWFANVYPKCRHADWRAPAPIEVIQQPGETMYVPAGWWHVVINLDPLCVAVTENFGAPQDFLYIRAALRAKRKDVDIQAWEQACRGRWGDKIPQ